MILHGVVPSPFTRKVMVVLEEKGIAYQRRDLAPFPKTSELLKMNPAGLIPILEVDGHLHCDSSAICQFLERLHPERPMYPEDIHAFATTLFLEEYADTIVMQAIAPVFRERFVKPNAFNQPADEAVVGRAMHETLPPVFTTLEARLQTNQFLQSELTVADAALGSILSCLHLAGERIDAKRWPALARYHSALIERPSFRKALPSPM